MEQYGVWVTGEPGSDGRWLRNPRHWGSPVLRGSKEYVEGHVAEYGLKEGLSFEIRPISEREPAYPHVPDAGDVRARVGALTAAREERVAVELVVLRLALPRLVVVHGGQGVVGDGAVAVLAFDGVHEARQCSARAAREVARFAALEADRDQRAEALH